MWRSATRNVLSRIKSNSKGNSRRWDTTESGSGGGQSPPNPKATPPPPQETVPPIQPKKSSKLRKFFIYGTGLLVVGGAAEIYIMYNYPKVRQWSDSNIPYSKEYFDFVIPQVDKFVIPLWNQYIKSSDPPKPQAVIEPIAPKPKKEEPIKEKQLSSEKPKVVKEEPQTQVKKEVAEEEPKKETKPEVVVKKEVEPVPTPVMSAKEKKKEEQRLKKEAEERRKEEAKRKLALKEAEEEAENSALKMKLENLEENLKTKAASAMEAQRELIDKVKAHTELLKTAMEDKSEILDKDSQWAKASTAFDNRQEVSKKVEELVQATKQDLEALKTIVSDGRKNAVTKKNKALTQAQETYNKLSNELNKVTAEVSKIESECKMRLKYKDLIDKGKKQFQKELESLLPDVKLGQGGKKLTEEELNSLIAHAHRRIEQLQKQLAEQSAMEEQRLQESLKQQQQEDDNLASERVRHALERAKNEFLLQKDNWELEARVFFERELKLQLARQTAAHSHHLQDVLAEQEKKFDKKLETELNFKVLEERKNFEVEVAGWTARQRGIEAAIDNRAEASKTAIQAQELWLACVALIGYIHNGVNKDAEWEEQLKPLNPEIEAIESASGHDPFVATVVNTIPEEALKRGVWTEQNLVSRFDNVYKLCKRVARIDETGASLYQYALSYLQSCITFPMVHLKASSDEVDTDTLNTYTILTHANYYVQKGDLEQALRFMNQLKGESRNVAKDWIYETRLLLETRQAALSLSAFASARGLGTIF